MTLGVLHKMLPSVKSVLLNVEIVFCFFRLTSAVL